MTTFERYTRGTRLCLDDQRHVLAVFVHRPMGGYKIPEHDGTWLEAYSFATRKDGRLDRRVSQCLPARLTGAA